MGAEFQLDHALIKNFLLNDSIVFAALEEAGHKALEHWKEIAPVNKKQDISAGKPHTLKSGYVDEPGSYRESIRMRMLKNPTRMKCRVEATDYKSYWLEGIKNPNKNNTPPPEPMMHTLAYMKSEGFGIGSEDVEGI